MNSINYEKVIQLLCDKCFHNVLPFPSVKDLNDVFTEPTYKKIDARVEAENIFFNHLEENRNQSNQYISSQYTKPVLIFSRVRIDA